MGYKTEQFVEKVDENLECSICLEVLEDPWQCKDGHTFCKDCITRYLGQNQICPVCKNALRVEDLARCLGMKNMIENLKVHCHPPESDGQAAAKSDAECDWIGKLHSLAKHRETCLFQQVQCPNENCNTNMQRRELEDHDKICEYKEVECEKCREVLVRFELLVHKNEECPEEMLPCGNRCKNSYGHIRKIKRKELEDHMKNECVKTILDCPFKDQGCSVQVERQHVEKHVQDNMAAHMMLLAKENKQLRQELNEVKKNDEDSRTYSWKIKNFRDLQRRQTSIRSPTFWLCGYSWYLRLDVGEEVSVSLYLDEESGSIPRDDTCQNNDITVSCRLTVASQESDTDDLSSEKRHVYCQSIPIFLDNLRWSGFIRVDDAAYFDEDGNLIIKCTIKVDHEKRYAQRDVRRFFQNLKKTR